MLKILSIALGLFIITGSVYAQKDKDLYKGFKPPKLKTYLAEYKDSVELSVADAKRIFSLPLQVNDGGKNNVYKLSSYQFLYRKLNLIEDEKGRRAVVNSSVSQLFRQTPLDAIWIKTINEDLKSGEELLFFDIIVKDVAGRVLYAPDIKIKVK